MKKIIAILFLTLVGISVAQANSGGLPWEKFPEERLQDVAALQNGAKLFVNEELKLAEPEQEYPLLYKRFAEIVNLRQTDVDLAPLTHVADAFMLGKRKFVEAFYD